MEQMQVDRARGRSRDAGRLHGDGGTVWLIESVFWWMVTYVGGGNAARHHRCDPDHSSEIEPFRVLLVPLMLQFKRTVSTVLQASRLGLALTFRNSKFADLCIR